MSNSSGTGNDLKLGTLDAQSAGLQVGEATPRVEIAKGFPSSGQAPELNPSAIFGNVPPFSQLQLTQVSKGADRATSDTSIQCGEDRSGDWCISADMAPDPMVSGVSPLQSSSMSPTLGVAASQAELFLAPMDTGSEPHEANTVEEIMVVEEATHATKVGGTIVNQVRLTEELHNSMERGQSPQDN
ncbi:hypothetical protein CDL15_Pgr029191 [Punica granatum]|uniref:Uncharacterized protein n=1 Tax=Punica granatum TaxID=22663 RepID=A0A218XDM0_PUNGR|nr:hypothetical protein CDL15_Pgr029191 [Punica granatum]